jgi:hypothetical protein
MYRRLCDVNPGDLPVGRPIQNRAGRSQSIRSSREAE